MIVINKNFPDNKFIVGPRSRKKQISALKVLFSCDFKQKETTDETKEKCNGFISLCGRRERYILKRHKGYPSTPVQRKGVNSVS